MEWDTVSMELFDRFGRYLGTRGMEAFEQRVAMLEDLELHLEAGTAPRMLVGRHMERD